MQPCRLFVGVYDIRAMMAEFRAGVVGLALARELTMAGREVIILESEDRFGTGTSSRNSEVVHAGMYYAAGTLKARLCPEGNRSLYEYCRARGIGHNRCGKLIVAAAAAELDGLRKIQAQAAANGVPEMEWLERERAVALEPRLQCVAALFSHSTGIVDSHGLMQALLQDAEDHGAAIVFRSPVTGGAAAEGGVELEVGGDEPMRILAGHVFNCAGLQAREVACAIRGVPAQAVPPLYYAKGNYYTRRRMSLLKRLVEFSGIPKERFKWTWVSASEGARWQKVVTDFVEGVKKLGPREGKAL